jgi:hypothetical protein
VSGKLSLIGVYGGDLIISGALPTVLPKLCIFVSAFFDPEKPVKTPRLIVYLPGDDDETPSINADLPWIADPLTSLPFPDALPTLNFRAHLTMSPAMLKEEGYVRVRLVHDNERIRVGALRVVARPEPKEDSPKR